MKEMRQTKKYEGEKYWQTLVRKTKRKKIYVGDVNPRRVLIVNCILRRKIGTGNNRKRTETRCGNWRTWQLILVLKEHARTHTHTRARAENFLPDWMIIDFLENGISSMELITVIYPSQPIPRAARFEEWFCRRFLVVIVGSNPAGGMDIFLLWM